MTYFLHAPIDGFRMALSLPAGEPRLFAFHKGNLVLDASGNVPTRTEAEAAGLEIDGMAPLGTLEGRPCVVAYLTPTRALPDGWSAKSLRFLFGALDVGVLSVAAVGSQVAHFMSTNKRCGTCGEPTVASEKERSVRCATCERDIYPAVSPCVIVLIHDGPRILLTRQPRFPRGLYGLVAGFVEAGESLETCARREIAEEVGIEIADLEYVASQPWPFPSQLMVGMTARYASGEIVVDTTELEDARWFDVGALPMIPPPFSIARHLIDRFMASYNERK
ncbi:MAG: NAD(+) diphosphatase [Polyangiaceae bacterium]|nr:NAD(+) diphosphatase [Polyangiaceae bacterium]